MVADRGSVPRRERGFGTSKVVAVRHFQGTVGHVVVAHHLERRQRPLWDSYPRQSKFLLDLFNDNVTVLDDIDGKYTLWLLQRG